MRYVIVGLLLWFTLTMSGSARSAEDIYPIIALRTSVMEEIKTGGSWKACGDYFAAGETTDGKIIHFTFEKKAIPKSETVFALGPIERLIISIDRRALTPVAIVRRTWVTLIMSPEDYLAGLPCLANGKGV